LVILLLTIILLSSSGSIKYLNYANAQESNDIQGEQPIINDPNLKTEVVVNGLELPTGMAFLGPDDILVTEKDKGTVRRVSTVRSYQNLYLMSMLQIRAKEEC
jgi:aldose sugar dehydrogenase